MILSVQNRTVGYYHFATLDELVNTSSGTWVGFDSAFTGNLIDANGTLTNQTLQITNWSAAENGKV